MVNNWNKFKLKKGITLNKLKIIKDILLILTKNSDCKIFEGKFLLNN